MRIFFQILAIFFLCLNSLPALAADIEKDSFYFMKDDSIFSPEEKDEEAEYIYQECNKNRYERTYYDCTCVAGAFRAERDKEVLIPQSNILDKIYQDKEGKCVNTAEIAGEAYSFCSQFSVFFRSRNKNNEDYCNCVANKAALSYKENPRLLMTNLERIRTSSMVSCSRSYR